MITLIWEFALIRIGHLLNQVGSAGSEVWSMEIGLVYGCLGRVLGMGKGCILTHGGLPHGLFDDVAQPGRVSNETGLTEVALRGGRGQSTREQVNDVVRTAMHVLHKARYLYKATTRSERDHKASHDHTQITYVIWRGFLLCVYACTLGNFYNIL